MGVRFSGPLVGRGTELERLEAAPARAAAGEPAVALVGGEAGVGKSRLVAEAAGRAHAAGARVLSGTCVQVGEEPLPYAPISNALRPLVRELDQAALDELVGPWRPELARLLPELGRPGPLADAAPDGHSAQGRLFELVLGLLERLAGQAPLLLVVEDLHWADRSSLELLAFLVHGLRAAPIMLLATYRSDEVHRRHRLRPLLADLDRHPAVERFELPRLDRGELGELLAARLECRPDAELTDRILLRSEGNPLFAEELLDAELHGEGALPTTLQDLLAARVEVLSEDARQVLRMAALIGRRVGHRLLAAACSLDQDALLGALREAVEAQVLLADQAADGYAFRHALLQEVVEVDLLPGERQVLHGILARTLVAHPELGSANPAEAAIEIATHWHAAGNQHQALLAAVEAGRQAQGALAFAEAQRHFERALELWDQAPRAVTELARADSPFDRVALLEQAAHAAHSAGEQQRAVALARAALAGVEAGAEPVRAGLLCERLARYLWLSGGNEALDLYQRAVDLVPAEPPSTARARVLAGQAHILNLVSQVEAARATAEEALAAARSAGARREEARALILLGSSTIGLTGHEAALAHLAEARRMAEELGDVDLLGLVFVYLPQALDAAGRLAEALAELLEMIERARRLGIERRAGAFLGGYAANLCFRLGRWDDADRHSRRALAVTPMPSVSAVHARLWRTRLEVERGEFAAAQWRLDEVERAVAGSSAPQFVSAIGELRAALAVWQGRPDDAAALVGRALELLADAEEEEVFRSLLAIGLRAQADLAERALARRLTADADAARQAGTALLGRFREMTEPAAAGGSEPQPETVAGAALGEAEATRLLGSSDPERWAAAAAGWERLGQPYHAAYARWREAEAVLAARGPRPPAAAVLRQAYQVTGELGAVPLHREIEGLARRARIDLGSAAPAPAEPSAAERLGLTPREREVLTLLADGRTNPQIAGELFISVKTVGIHVSSILAKLGVANRGEAAAAAHRGGLVDHPAR